MNKPLRTLGKKENFLGLEDRFSSYSSSKVVVLPVPYEHTVSYGGGTGRGPRAILDASRYVEFYDEELETELCTRVGIATLPPLALGQSTDARAMGKIRTAAEKLLDDGKFVAVLGGEHTISQATIRAHLDRYPDLSILHFDAHADLRQAYEGNRYSHACVMARVCEYMEPARIVQVGIRALSPEEAQFIRTSGITTLYAHQIRSNEEWMAAILPKLSPNVYVTFDVDAFDPPLMPSTGTPEPNGLQWPETMRLLRQVGEQRRIVGFDVVEFAPHRGMSHPDYTAAKLTYKLMNYACRSSE
ncbi:MAG: agmatinase [Opitutaceae bacterium]|nr:agmatinase [Opitutaceae bacterium]